MERLLPVKAIRAAVMIPLIETEEGLSVLFNVRSSRVGQPGEICFPGGRLERDETPAEAAVRETMEELLVDEDRIEMLAPMYKMIGPGGADISSFAGIIRDYEGSFNEMEISSVFSIPLEKLMKLEHRESLGRFIINLAEDFPVELIPDGENYKWLSIKKNYYFYETEFGVIWGMTGELLYSFLKYADRFYGKP